jgi:hypothetical protein
VSKSFLTIRKVIWKGKTCLIENMMLKLCRYEGHKIMMAHLAQNVHSLRVLSPKAPKCLQFQEKGLWDF